MRKQSGRLYLIPVLSKALDILDIFQTSNRPLTLEVIHQRTSFSKTTIYRILKTLSHRGYLAQTESGAYRLISRPRKIRFGFGSESAELQFSEVVTNSLRAAAASAGVELLVLDNRYDAATALKNVDEFLSRRVDLMIEFQINERIAPTIADKIHEAGVPLIAVDIPHPHATFFGVDNYRVGYEAGNYLAEYAKRHWKAQVSWVLGLGLEEAGALVQSRITGAFDAVRAVLPSIPEERIRRLEGRGLREISRKVVTEFLRKHSKDCGILVAAATDTSALGALEAVRNEKRTADVAIVGQDYIPEAAEALKEAGPFIASVSHEAHTYGPRLIQLGLSLLNGETVAPYNYVEHRLVTAAPAANSSTKGRSRRGGTRVALQNRR